MTMWKSAINDPQCITQHHPSKDLSQQWAFSVHAGAKFKMFYIVYTDVQRSNPRDSNQLSFFFQ